MKILEGRVVLLFTWRPRNAVGYTANRYLVRIVWNATSFSENKDVVKMIFVSNEFRSLLYLWKVKPDSRKFFVNSQIWQSCKITYLTVELRRSTQIGQFDTLGKNGFASLHFLNILIDRSKSSTIQAYKRVYRAPDLYCFRVSYW